MHAKRKVARKSKRNQKWYLASVEKDGMEHETAQHRKQLHSHKNFNRVKLRSTEDFLFKVII